jgi:adenine-specific DNA-methyltransferase
MKTVSTYTTVRSTLNWLEGNVDTKAAVYHGDCELLLPKIPENSVDMIITSPPYCMGKPYEKDNDVETFVKAHERVLPMVVRILKPGGSLCWQVGHHVKNGIVTPLDFLVFQQLAKFPEMKLRNRIIWTFGHGLHCNNRFSGRHESVLWFTKGDEFDFDLDAVRVPQKYPGKRQSRGPRRGELSGNPNGKNPGDVWDIPNVNSNHLEKTPHPCQFPIGLAERLIRALSKPGDLVLDPFCGVASSGVAALLGDRRFLGGEIENEYVELAQGRLESAANKTIKYRPADRAIHVPSPNAAVAIRPSEFAVSIGSEEDANSSDQALDGEHGPLEFACEQAGG